MSRPTGPVQTPVPGFLSLLNLKNVGQLPDELLGTVQPVMDHQGFLQRGSLQNFPTFPGAAQGVLVYRGFVPADAAATLTVPGNEWWWVENLTIRANAGAGATLDMFAAAFQVPGGSNPFFVVGNQDVLTAGKTCAMSVAQDFWMPPGSIVGMLVGSIAVAAVQFDTIGFRFARFLT